MSLAAFLQELYKQALRTLSNGRLDKDYIPFNWKIWSKVKTTKDCGILLYFDFRYIILDEDWE